LLFVALLACVAIVDGAALNCTTYCTTMLGGGCGSIFSSNITLATQYCGFECEILSFRLGAAGDTTGNTLGCRLHFAAIAATAPTAANCLSAAPWSDKCISTAKIANINPAALCDSLCDKQALACGGSILPYVNIFFTGATYSNPLGASVTLTNWQQCMTECALLPYYPTAQTPTGTFSGDSRSCRYTHITLAVQKLGNIPYSQFHCPHTSPAGGSPGNMVCWTNPGFTLPAGGDYLYGLCENYCDIILGPGACPGGTGNIAYPDYTSCLGACVSFPILSLGPSTPGINMTYHKGDSFECRRHWTFQAVFDQANSFPSAVQGDCGIGGNFGGDILSPPLNNPICGDACSFYCDEMNGPQDNLLRGGHCTVALGGYASWASCYTTCKSSLYANRASFAQLTDFTKLTSSNTLDCRVVFAGLAANVTVAPSMCAIASVNSVTGYCAAPVPKSSTGTHISSTGVSAATALQVSFSVVLVACIAAFFGSRRV